MQKKKWIRTRHRVVIEIARFILTPIAKIKYHITIEPFKEQQERPYLVLMNHQTPFDQFFVGISFKGPLYYLATEDIFSNGFVSSLIRFLVAPIPIRKQTADVTAVKNCYKIAKEGGSICICPEGNRTYSGRTEYMNPAIASMAKALRMPIALYRVEGGYGAEPRWSDVTRKGKMRSYVARVIEPDEYKNMTDEELLATIQEGLYVNEAKTDEEYHHKKLAEYLDRAMYVCPNCGLSVFYSKDDIIECQKCHQKIQYLPTKELKGIDFEFPFQFVAQWYDYQKDYVNSLDLLNMCEAPLYEDSASISEVILYKNKKKLHKNTAISLFGDKIYIQAPDGTGYTFLFTETKAVTVLGRNKLNIYYNDKVYQLKGDKHFNALKYVNIFHRHKNIVKGDVNGKFLGL